MALSYKTTGLRVYDAFTPTAAFPRTYNVGAPVGPTDVYVRSVWFPHFGYKFLTGSPPSEGWWMTTAVRCLVNWDPTGLGNSSDVNDNDPNTLGVISMHPRYYPLQTSPNYVVKWTPEQGSLILKTKRDSNGTDTAQVSITLFADDSVGAFGTTLYPGAGLFFGCEARVLWGTP
jgi:hypothetical protein